MRPQNRLLLHTSSYAIIAVSAFHFGTCAFPIAEATQLQMRGIATFMNSAVRVQFRQSARRLSHCQPVSGVSVCPSGCQVLSILGIVSRFFLEELSIRHFSSEGNSVIFLSSFPQSSSRASSRSSKSPVIRTRFRSAAILCIQLAYL